LLMFASLARDGFPGFPAIMHGLMTTRREERNSSTEPDELYTAAAAVGLDYFAVPERKAFDFGVVARMASVLRQIRPDIVETHDCKSHLLHFVIRALYDDLRSAKWIAFHHGYTRTSRKVLLYQQLDRLSLRFADRVITVCRPFANVLESRGVPSQRITVISNAIAERAAPAADVIDQVRARLGIQPGEFMILTVGRLSREKGHDDLLVAFRALLERSGSNRIRLVIAGDGPEKGRLEASVVPLGARVCFAGHVADPWPLYHAAQAFVLPSHSEGSPLVILEAMAAGVPIVATRVGGIPEVLHDRESALLVPARAPRALEQALCYLLEDHALGANLAAGASIALARHSPSAYSHRLLAIYTAVQAAKPR